MKKSFLLTGILLVLAGCSKPDPEAEKLDAEAAVKGFYKAAESFDTETMKSFCTTDFYCLENGIVYNNLDEFIEMAKSLEGATGQINMDFVKTDLTGNSALLIVKFDAVWTKGPVQWFFKTIENYVLKKVEGKWLIRFFQSTYLPDEHDKKFTSLHLLKVPENLSLSVLDDAVKKLNAVIAGIGYPDCGYKVLQVVPGDDSKFNWIMEGNWKNTDVYKIIHENEDYKKELEQIRPQIMPLFKDQIYLKVALP